MVVNILIHCDFIIFKSLEAFIIVNSIEMTTSRKGSSKDENHP